MVTTNSKQMTSGKAFEYALLAQFYEKLKDKTNVEVVENSSYKIASGCFENSPESVKSDLLLTSSFTVNFLMDIEPRLTHDLGDNDILQLEILSDDYGKLGDVRDVLAIRLLQKWEIGVSAKNNHRAVKHCRLSNLIDFGEKWVGVKVSNNYFESISPVFDKLEQLRNKSNAQMRWKEYSDYHATVYVPVLQAFMAELIKLNENNPEIPAKLVSFLVGVKDFYKVIKKRNKVEIHAYNLHGTLNLAFNNIEPKYKTPLVPLPTRILDVRFKENSKTTVIVTMNEDWILSFRIHNASSRIESSLKFDINLVSSPNKLFKNFLNFGKD
ncbi:hypothetical protein MASR1M107_02540 [Ignavibacteriales bacterium]